MNPLSMKKYFENNIKKVIGQIISLSLGVVIIYFIFAIGGGFLTVVSKLQEVPFKDKVTFISSEDEESTKKLEECYGELIENNEVDRVLKIEYNSSTMKTIMGMMGCRVYGLGREDIKYIFNKENYKLTEGRLPEENDEIVASVEYVKANGYKINDYIGNEVRDSEQLIGKKKLVGIFNGEEITAYYLNDNIRSYGYLALFNNFEEIEKISDKYEKDIRIIDKNTHSKYSTSLKTSFKFFGAFIIGIMILIEWVILNNLMYINLFSRKGELALLYAIGQSDKKIRKMIMAEQGAIIFVGYFLGVLIGIIGMIFFNSVYLEVVGQKFPIFSPWYLLGGFILSLMMILTSRLPLRKFFKKVDRVVVLEGS